jgi:hypothetical protein
VILAIQEAEIRRIGVGSQPGQIVHEALSWNKCKALSSSPNATKKKKILGLQCTNTFEGECKMEPKKQEDW